MNHTVAHAETKRPLKSTRLALKTGTEAGADTAPPSESRRVAMFGALDDAHEYGRGCLTEARDTVARMSLAVLVDEDDLDREKFRRLASGLLTNIGGAEDAIDTLALTAPSGGPAPIGAPRFAARDGESERALNSLGNIVSLREAVDDAVSEIDGIVSECRAALDAAAAMHVYVAGRNRADNHDKFYAPSADPSGDFNERMAEAVGALVCLQSYVANLRPEALRKKLSEGADPTNYIDAAAEE